MRRALFLLVLLPLLGAASPVVTTTQPGGNILLIIVDDVGVSGVSCYPESQHTPCAPSTPNIDSLARRGVQFRNAWVNPMCSPARAAIHTGRHAFRTGVGTAILRVGRNVLHPCELTIAKALQSYGGYSTALIGKWHLGNKNNGRTRGPHLAGWSHFVGSMYSGIRPPHDYYHWPRTVNGETRICHNYAATQKVDDALAWVGCQEQPWLCCVSFNLAHAPFHAPPAHLVHHPVPENASAPARYRAMVEAADTEIGRLLQGIGPELENTTVIVIGDNGPPEEVVLPPLDPRKVKGTVYQGGVHVPLIIAGPAVVEPGRKEHALTHAVDLFSTTIELAGLELSELPLPCALDSVSLFPYLVAADSPPLRRTVYTEAFLLQNPNLGYAAMRNERYKIIRNPGRRGRYEMYDLWTDPLEENDLLRRGRKLPQSVVMEYRHLRAEMQALRGRR